MTGSTMLWLGICMAMASVTMTVVLVGLLWDRWHEAKARRAMLARVGRPEEHQTQDTEPTALELFRETVSSTPGRLDRLAETLPRAADLRRLIEQAGLGWSPSRFVGLTVMSTLAASATGYLFTGYAAFALPPGLLGATVPWIYARRRKAKRVAAFEELFPDAIDLLGRATRAGHAFSTSLKMVADEMANPLGPEFRRVFDEQKFGLPLDESLAGLAERVDLPDVRIFNTGVLIPREVGGNLAEILDNLARTIRERFTIQRQVRVYTAQGRFTGYLLAVLPIVLGVLIYLLNRDYMSVLWAESLGRLLIATALLLQVVGFFVIRRIVDIQV